MITVTGAPALAATFTDLAKVATPRPLRLALRVGAEPIRDRASQLCKRGGGAPDLADHIVISPGRGDEHSGVMLVGPSREARSDREDVTFDVQALFQEYGTAKQPAHAFLRPALDTEGARAGDLITASLWRAFVAAGSLQGSTT